MEMKMFHVKHLRFYYQYDLITFMKKVPFVSGEKKMKKIFKLALDLELTPGDIVSSILTKEKNSKN